MSDDLRNIRVTSYVQQSSRNYGLNSILVELGMIDLYFSYQTVVAFRSPDTGLVISENNWGPTTGKHLNAIGHKDVRTSREEFETQLNELLKKHGLQTPRIDV